MIEDKALVLDCMLRELVVHRRITLPDLCDHLQIERHALQGLVIKETGMSFRSLRQLVCMQLAATQLLDSLVSVKEGAFGLGYRFPCNFTRAFKGFFGVNPEDFRISSRDQWTEISSSLNDTSFPLIPLPNLPYLRAIVSRSPESRL